MKNIFKICLGYFMLNSVAYAQPIKYFDLNIIINPKKGEKHVK
jgi:hypothetical protein